MLFVARNGRSLRRNLQRTARNTSKRGCGVDYGFQISVKGRWLRGYVEVVSDGLSQPTPLWKINDVWVKVRDHYNAAGHEDAEVIRKHLYRDHGFNIASAWMESQKIEPHRSVKEFQNWRREYM